MEHNEKKQCKLCRQFFDDSEMSEEHYPAHSVGNDDIIGLDFTKMMDSLMGDDPDFNRFMSDGLRQGKSVQELNDYYFDNKWSKSLYPKGRTARTLCRKCNTFIGKYDEAYLKFFNEDGNPKRVKGFQQKTKLYIVKSIYAKFISIPETQNESFDFLDFILDEDACEYNGDWRLYFIKRDYSTDIMGFQDISTGKLQWDEKGVVYELSDDKFIFNLMNFEKHDEFEMNNIFDILKKKYSLVEGNSNESGGYHGQIMLLKAFGGLEL